MMGTKASYNAENAVFYPKIKTQNLNEGEIGFITAGIKR